MLPEEMSRRVKMEVRRLRGPAEAERAVMSLVRLATEPELAMI